MHFAVLSLHYGLLLGASDKPTTTAWAYSQDPGRPDWPNSMQHILHICRIGAIAPVQQNAFHLQPNAASEQPYGAHGQLYEASEQPYGRHVQPYGTSEQPYVAPKTPKSSL